MGGGGGVCKAHPVVAGLLLGVYSVLRCVCVCACVCICVYCILPTHVCVRWMCGTTIDSTRRIS